MKWLHLKGQTIFWTERRKTSLRSSGCRVAGKPDERSNPLDAGRMRRNCLKVFRVHNLEQTMVRHSRKASELWKVSPWKKFWVNLSSYKSECTKPLGKKTSAISATTDSRNFIA